MIADRAAGAAGVLAGTVVVAASISLGVGGPIDPGPGFFPALAGGVLAAISAALALGSRESAPLAIDRRPIVRAAAHSGAMLAYAALLEPLGFLAATFVTASLVLRLQGIAWREAAGVSAALSLATSVVFAGLLDVELPAGLVGRLLR